MNYRHINPELSEAVDKVLRKHFDFYFDREKARKVLTEWAKEVIRDEPSTAIDFNPARGDVLVFKD